MTARGAVAIALLSACATSRPPAAPGPPAAVQAAASIPPASLGLVPGSVFDEPAPPAIPPNDTAPGALPTLPRPYRDAPPRIPHAIRPFTPITRTENRCIGCHSARAEEALTATPLPPTHLVDREVAGRRWDCLSCHVPSTGARPLVENRFRP